MTSIPGPSLLFSAVDKRVALEWHVVWSVLCSFCRLGKSHEFLRQRVQRAGKKAKSPRLPHTSRSQQVAQCFDFAIAKTEPAFFAQWKGTLAKSLINHYLVRVIANACDMCACSNEHELVRGKAKSLKPSKDWRLARLVRSTNKRRRWLKEQKMMKYMLC